MKKRIGFPTFFAIFFVAVVIALIYTVSTLSHNDTHITSSIETSATELNEESSAVKKDIGITSVETLISCITINNPSEFKKVSKANVTQLMGITLWCVLENDSENYYDFNGKRMVIKKDTVEQMFYSLFTSDVSPCHTTIKSSGITFSYDENENVYYVPITSVTPKYTAEIIKKKQKGNTVTVKTDFIPQSNWVQDVNGNILPPKKEKTAVITLKQKSDKTLTVCSVVY